VSEPYWSVWQLCNGERVWWSDDLEDWVDREEATEEKSKIAGCLARDRARAHAVREADKEPWEAVYKSVHLSRFTSKGYRDPRKVEKELEDTQRRSKEVSTLMEARFKALLEILTNPNAMRMKAGGFGHSGVYDLVWNLRDAYIHEQQTHADALKDCEHWKQLALKEQEQKIHAWDAIRDGNPSSALTVLLDDRDRRILGLAVALQKLYNEGLPLLTELNGWCNTHGLIKVKDTGVKVVV
jgi:hypothetical protein